MVKGVVIISIWAITIFFLAGCAPIMTVVDNVHTDQPKGYVKFYCDKAYGSRDFCYTVYDPMNDDYIGKVPSSFVAERRKCLRVAQNPGVYTFRVLATGTGGPRAGYCGNSEDTVVLRVFEGKITPVKLGLKQVPSSPYTGALYILNPRVESPIPLSK